MSGAGWVVFLAREFGLRHRRTAVVPFTITAGSVWASTHPRTVGAR